MSPGFTLHTEQETVVLRQLTPEDSLVYFNVVNANREHLSQFNDITATKYPTLESVRDSITNPDNPDKLRMGIWDVSTFVGSINLTPSADASDAEIGYWLDQKQTGKGYATVAARALAEYGQQKYGQVHANVVAGNDASVRVLERAGFRLTSKRAGTLVFKLMTK